MGSLASDISSFLFLFPIGIRRLISAYSLHLHHQHHYLAKPWYFSSSVPPPPTTSSHNRLLLLLKNIDLYFPLVALPIAVFSEIFLFLTTTPPLQRLPFSNQSTILSLFWLLLLSISLRRHVATFFPDDLLFLLAALAFLADLFLSVGPTEVGPIEDRVYRLLSLVTAACAAASLALAAQRTLFAADVALAAGMALKGTWALQAGVVLFGFPPSGCRRRRDGGVVAAVLECELDEDKLRGVAVVDLLFVSHAVVIGVMCLLLFGVVARGVNRTAAAEGEELASAITSPMMGRTFEME